MVIPAVGYFASAMSIGMFIPQLVQSWKTKKTDGISTLSFMLVALQNVSWMSYGLLLVVDSADIHERRRTASGDDHSVREVEVRLTRQSGPSLQPRADQDQAFSSAVPSGTLHSPRISHALLSASFSSSVT